MKKVFLILTLLAILSAKGQYVTFLKETNTQLEDVLYLDRFGNKYGLLKKQFVCESEDQKLQFFAELLYGNPTLVDGKSPLRILIFYADFQTAVLTDNQMNSTEKIDFKSIENRQVTWVAISTQNQLWFYDELSQKIGLHNILTNKTRWQTTPLLKPKEFYSNYNSVYFENEKAELIKISQNGNQKKLGLIPQHEEIKIISDSTILLINNNKLSVFNLNTKKQTELITSEKSIKDFFINGDILSIFTEDKIMNYKLNLL